jgi:hypothetical protein
MCETGAAQMSDYITREELAAVLRRHNPSTNSQLADLIDPPKRRFAVGDWVQEDVAAIGLLYRIPHADGGNIYSILGLGEVGYDVKAHSDGCWSGQGITYLRESHFHLIPPRPTDEQLKKWSKVIVGCMHVKTGELAACSDNCTYFTVTEHDMPLLAKLPFSGIRWIIADASIRPYPRRWRGIVLRPEWRMKRAPSGPRVVQYCNATFSKGTSRWATRSTLQP